MLIAAIVAIVGQTVSKVGWLAQRESPGYRAFAEQLFPTAILMQNDAFQE